jgi:hypothetical protein
MPEEIRVPLCDEYCASNLQLRDFFFWCAQFWQHGHGSDNWGEQWRGAKGYDGMWRDGVPLWRRSSRVNAGAHRHREGISAASHPLMTFNSVGRSE